MADDFMYNIYVRVMRELIFFFIKNNLIGQYSLWFRLTISTTFVIIVFASFGGCGEGVNAPDCGSGTRGFDSLHPPHWGVAKR